MAKKLQTNGNEATASAGSNELPEGWAVTDLGELISPSKEKIDPKLCPDAPYLSLEHIESGTNRIESQGIASDVKSTKAVFHSGDVLYGKLRPYLNKVAIPEFDGVCSTDILVFRPSRGLLSQYLLRFLSESAFVQYATDHQKGNSLPRVSFGDLAKYPMPLPPLAEQKRIVTKVEALLERVNKARERLDRVPDILKKFRQSVLAAACSGRLTADWREEKGLTANVDWTETQLERVCESISDGDHLPPPKQDKGIPFLTIGNINKGELDFSTTRFVPKSYFDKIKPIRIPRPGDVLYSVVGATIGIPALVDVDRPFCFQRHIAILKPGKLLLSEYLVRLMESPSVFRQAWSNVTGTAQPTLPLGSLRAIDILLPPLEEQQEIVSRLNSLFACASRIEESLAAGTERTRQISNSVLTKAFAGELVETEADLARREGRVYEPAWVLLERIKDEREDNNAQKSKTRRKKLAKRKKTTAKRPLVDVLNEVDDGMGPEQLLQRAGFDEGTVEDFYRELRDLIEAGAVVEERVNDADVRLSAGTS